MQNRSKLSHPDLCIVADDLTGALDAAAPFARRGLNTTVAFTPQAMAEALDAGSKVVTVSTQSREITPAEAHQAVKEVVASLHSETRIFKKIDSRLKGNVETELTALKAEGFLVAPAIPEFGRIVRDGAVSGFGIDAPIAITPRMGKLATLTLAPDTESLAEMREALDENPKRLPVGARGLAEALAQRISGKETAEGMLALTARSALFVIGSYDPITLAQVTSLKSDPSIKWIGAPNGIAQRPIPTNGMVVIQALEGSNVLTGGEVAKNLALSLPQHGPDFPDLLFLTGGATAEAILSSLDIHSATLVGEILPGLPVMQTNGLTIVTKSGGFGDLNTLVELIALLRKGAN